MAFDKEELGAGKLLSVQNSGDEDAPLKLMAGMTDVTEDITNQIASEIGGDQKIYRVDAYFFGDPTTATITRTNFNAEEIQTLVDADTPPDISFYASNMTGKLSYALQHSMVGFMDFFEGVIAFSPYAITDESRPCYVVSLGVNRYPSSSPFTLKVMPVVQPMALIEDATSETLLTQFNALLAELKSHGYMETT